MKHLSEKQARRYLAKYEHVVRYRAWGYIGLARKCCLSVVDLEDLRQIGRMAVIEAISGYQTPYPVTEHAFVVTRISHRMIDEIRSRSYLTRDQIFLATRRGGRVGRAIFSEHVSLSEYRYRDTELLWADTIADTGAIMSDELVEGKRIADRVMDALSTIPPREAQAVRARLFDESMLHEAGEKMGVTDSRVCQLQKRGLRRIKQKMHPKQTAWEIVAGE